MPSTVTTLVENRVAGNRTDLVSEHGLSFLVETGDRRILFDTGASDRFLRNGTVLGLFPGPLDAVVLSHGHYDHAGGLPALLSAMAEPVDLYAGPEIFAPRYIVRDGRRREIGPPAPESAAAGLRFHPVEKPTLLAPGLAVSGEIPMVVDFESADPAFLRESPSGPVPDLFIEERVLVLETGDGPAVLVGCAHRGIVNALRHLSEAMGYARIHAVLGGLHLMNAEPERIDRTIDAFRAFGVERIGVGHCTGDAAISALDRAFPGRVFDIGAGARIQFPDP